VKVVLLLTLCLTSSWAFAAKVLNVEKPLTLVQGQEFQVPKPAMGAYGVLNENLVTLTMQGDKVIINANKHHGKALIQVLHTDGTISNYQLEVIPNYKVAYFNKQSLYKGYNLIISNEYLDFKSSPSGIRAGGPLNSSYRGRVILTTRVGDNGKFSGRVDYRENFPTLFYVRADYKKVYVGYGDLPLQLNTYKPTFINQPRLRQHTAGWDGERFDLDLWSGQLSPLPNSNAFRVSEVPGIRTSNFNTIQDQFSGARIRYKFKNGDSIFASSWYNHETQRQVPYVGYTYVNPKIGITNSTTVGNTQEAPVFSNRFTYQNKNRSKFTLQRLNFLYEIAEKGFDNLLFTSLLPTEKIAISSQFYNGKKFTDAGSPYLNLGYGYTLNGFTTNEAYSGKVGWQNSMVNVGVEGNYGSQKFTFAPGKVFPQRRLSPSIDLWLNSPAANWRYKLGVMQSFSDIEFTNGPLEQQETTLTLSTRHKKGLGLSLGVGRFNFKSQFTEQNGYRIIPRAEYRKENLTFFAQGNLSYVDQAPLNSQDSNFILGQERYSGGLKYTYNKKHILEARYTKATDGINDREFSVLSVGYTLKLGHPTKSIVSIFDSKKISGKIFEDLNLNGLQDKEEVGVKGLVIKVVSDKGDTQSTTTDKEGYFKLSGLNEEIYSFSVEGSEGYSLSSLPGNLNFKLQESYSYNIPAVKTKNIEVKIEGNDENTVMANVLCGAEEKSVNKVPAFVGKVNSISVPEKNDCKISLEIFSQSNISVSPEFISTKEKKFNFKFISSKVLLGQAYEDKNKNGYYDMGEELTNVSVVFDKLTIKTDENGIFTSKISEKINKIKFLRVNGYKCLLRNPEIEDFSSGKIISLPCRK
jgi:hypothetical protein